MLRPPPVGVEVVAIVPAAGRGERLGGPTAKALVEVGGLSLLRRCVDGLQASGVVDLIVVVAPPNLLAAARAALPAGVRVVAGGAHRSDSVRNGLADALAAAPGAQYVLVHDAARALTPAELVRSVVAALRAGARAVIPVLPVTDTIKEVDGAGVVVATPERGSLRAVQTPQGFTAEVLRAAYRAPRSATDDAGLVEECGVGVQTVVGHPLAFKITSATDLAFAQALVEVGE